MYAMFYRLLRFRPKTYNMPRNRNCTFIFIPAFIAYMAPLTLRGTGCGFQYCCRITVPCRVFALFRIFKSADFTSIFYLSFFRTGRRLRRRFVTVSGCGDIIVFFCFPALVAFVLRISLFGTGRLYRFTFHEIVLNAERITCTLSRTVGRTIVCFPSALSMFLSIRVAVQCRRPIIPVHVKYTLLSVFDL